MAPLALPEDIVARLQKTTIGADPPGVNRSIAIIEPELDGEIAVRRQRAAGHGGGTAQLTQPKAPGGPATPLSDRGEPTVRVEDFERIEDYLRAYLAGERFSSIHPLARGRWVVAWEMLWCADSRAKVIAVGQRARDALQAFASSLLEHCVPLAMDPHWPDLLAGGSQRPEPLQGLAMVADAYRQDLGEERWELLRGLLEHWRTLLEAIERHQQPSRAPDERLRWEDGRRLVLLTALVMVEVDRSFA